MKKGVQFMAVYLAKKTKLNRVVISKYLNDEFVPQDQFKKLKKAYEDTVFEHNKLLNSINFASVRRMEYMISGKKVAYCSERGIATTSLNKALNKDYDMDINRRMNILYPLYLHLSGDENNVAGIEDAIERLNGYGKVL